MKSDATAVIELATFLVIAQDLEDSGRDHVHLVGVLALLEDLIPDLQVDLNLALLDPAASHLTIVDETPAADQCLEKIVVEAPSEREIVAVAEVLMTNPEARNLKEGDATVPGQTAVAVMIEAPRKP